MAHLVADNLVLLLVVQRGYCETAFIVRVNVVVNVSDMRIVFMQRIWSSIVARDILVGLYEAPSWAWSIRYGPLEPSLKIERVTRPTFLKHLPMNRRVRDDVL